MSDGFQILERERVSLDLPIALRTAPESPRWRDHDADAVFAPLPPLQPLVEGFGFYPGPPTIFAGAGFTMKTLATQSLALSVASGVEAVGRFPVRQGRVRHLDLEQGQRITFERYQRLAAGLGIGVEELRGRLSVVIANAPEVHLDSPRAGDVYASEFDGYALAAIDSFRAATPNADENSSEVRRYLDLLANVSEKTGCAFIVIHHARKSIDGAADRASLRGSSAIFDAAAAVYVFSRARRHEPVLVRHEKDRVTGVLQPDLWLTASSDAAGADTSVTPLMVRIVDEPVSERRQRGAKASGEKASLKKTEIVQFVATCAAPVSKNEIVAAVKGSRELVLTLVDELVADEALEAIGGSTRPKYVARASRSARVT